MADTLVNGATVERKAVFIKSFSRGKTEFRRLPFDIEIRTWPTKAKGGRKTFISFNYGRRPDRANDAIGQKGEWYDAIEYYDVYPATWPKIGIPS
jgi:hypothetical protein